jgi:hypothetical protein
VLRHYFVIRASTFVILFGLAAAGDDLPLKIGLPKTGMRPRWPEAALFYFIRADYALEWGEMRKP